jgi:CheY-like chemotaxis protein
MIESLKIMIVDDSDQMRRMLKAMLMSFGVTQIIIANNGHDALQMTRETWPDIIITDWNMKPTNGIQLAQALRWDTTSYNPYVPILLLTGHADKERIIEARDAGITEIMVKPVSPTALHQRLITMIEKPRPFVEEKGYFGPDRRRRNLEIPQASDRRSRLSAQIRHSFDKLLKIVN